MSRNRRFAKRPRFHVRYTPFIDAHEANPKPSVWTKSADEILASSARFAQRTADARAAQQKSRNQVTEH